MARKPAKPAQDVVALPAGAKAADPANPQPPVPASKDVAQVQAGGGDAPADLSTAHNDDQSKYGFLSRTNLNAVVAALSEAAGEVATQMPEKPAAVPPAAGDAPVATSTTYAAKTVTVSIFGNPVLRVTGPAKGRWRAGRHFTPEAVMIPVRDLNDDEMAALVNDPELVVSLHNDI